MHKHDIQLQRRRLDRQLIETEAGTLERLLESRCLLLGFNGIGVEIAKNLLLQGIGSLVIWDRSNVDWDDVSSGFVFSPSSLGAPRIHDSHIAKLRLLNPFATVETLSCSDDELLSSVEIDQFTCVVVACQLDRRFISRITEQVRSEDSIIFCNARSLCCFVSRGVPVVETGEFYDDYDSKKRMRDGVVMSVSECFLFPIHACFESLLKLVEQTGSFEDSAQLRKLILAEILSEEQGEEDADPEVVRVVDLFVKTCGVSPPPGLVTLVGGYVSNEVMSVVVPNTFKSNEEEDGSSSFRYFAMQFFDILPKERFAGGAEENEEEGESLEGSLERYHSTARLFGSDFVQKMRSLKIFLPGMGALGCESLKLLAQMGVSRMSVTDFDGIEISNLSRQFLFRQKDLTKKKSVVAAKRIRKIVVRGSDDEELQVEAHEKAVQDPSVFTNEFYSSLDAVVMGFDNVEARNYTARMCKLFNLVLFDSGIRGRSGNTQVAQPHITRGYRKGVVAEERVTASCTIKNRPSRPEHLIEWAKDLFLDLFHHRPLSHQRREKSCPFLSKNVRTVDDCVAIAAQVYRLYFRDNIQLLVRGGLHKDEILYCPRVLSVEDELDLAFVRTTAILYSKIFGIRSSEELSVEDDMIKSVLLDPSVSVMSSDVHSSLTPIPFEKDDDLHVEFVKHASNLRLLNYSLNDPAGTPTPFPEVEFRQAKLLSGHIIPASQSAAAFAQGLVALELMAVVANTRVDGSNDVDLHNHTFDMDYGQFGKTFTKNDGKWITEDRFIQSKDCSTLRILLKYLCDQGFVPTRVSHLSLGPTLIYFPFTENLNSDEALDMPLRNRLQELVGHPIHLSRVLLRVAYKTRPERTRDRSGRKKSEKVSFDVVCLLE